MELFIETYPEVHQFLSCPQISNLCYFLPVSMVRKSTFTLEYTDYGFRFSGFAIRSRHHTSIL